MRAKWTLVVFLPVLLSCAKTMNFGFDDADEGDASGEFAEEGDNDEIEEVVKKSDDTPPSDTTRISAAAREQATPCGDGVCDGTENECSCTADCGSCTDREVERCAHYECTALQACVKVREPDCCGDAACTGGESCGNCMIDCCTAQRTLADFPAKFERLTIVVGEDAPAQDIVTAANLAGVLKQLDIRMGETKLDREVLDLRTRDYLVVGSPCDNTAAATLLGIPSERHKNQCAVIPYGEGHIRLIATNDANVALLITGGSPRDVEHAAKRLAEFQQRPLSGTLVTV